MAGELEFSPIGSAFFVEQCGDTDFHFVDVYSFVAIIFSVAIYIS